MRPHNLLLGLTLLATNAAAGELHVFTSDASGFNTHSVWYDDGQEVTVFDTQFTPQYAQLLIDNIRRETGSPITRVIITHPNPDKFNGIAAFREIDTEIIASATTAEAMPGVDEYKRHFLVNVAQMFSAEDYPVLQTVDTTFSGRLEIMLNSGETITLFELPAGISSTQTVARIDATGDLIVGDLIHSNTHAWLEGGIVNGQAVPEVDSWKDVLATLNTLGTGTAYGGRGDFLPVVEAVEQQTAYLTRAVEIVDDYIESLGDQRSELSDAEKQAEHYAAIQARFVEAFPSYGQPELVGFSVYGLVHQRLTAAP
ncbi:MBL fold metallo-hydrolase [Pseudogemmobacter sonorensis]|uniref:MBL fold metallo-hydrolase n=1 Tax=Pseudogemmobacter sonorensis TaxID=2989681 RepID=UPI0036922464